MTTSAARPTARTRPAAARSVPRPRDLAEQLAAATRTARHPLEVALSAVSSALLLLGAGELLRTRMLHHLLDAPDPIAVTRGLWRTTMTEAPFLHGHMGALLDWTGPVPGEQQVDGADVDGFRRCVAVLLDVDVRAVVQDPAVAGDLLGPLYTYLRSGSTAKGLGAFFTPAPVAAVMAAALAVPAGATVAEPAAGTGGMLVATARAMRAAGHDPATVRWAVNDLDPMAVALGGVNALINGLGPHVTLTCGDMLRAG